jgi:hypothetical protein
MFGSDAEIFSSTSTGRGRAPIWKIGHGDCLPVRRVSGRLSTPRLLHEAAELEGDRDEGMREHWLGRGLFASVVFEDIGLQGTIFDPYDTREYAQRLAELETQLTAQFAVVANETPMRTGDLDPRLRDMLHAAFIS